MERIGILLLHGFAGDVHEVLPLARSLQEEGYIVECPTLAGHGHSRRHLGRSTRRQWIASAEEAYKRLSMRTSQIIVIGFSMGGLLAFHVASRHPVKLLFTLNTPYHYWDVKQAVTNLGEDFRSHARRYLRGMTRIPLRSMLQFRLLLTETKRILPQITSPYVILQGRRDDTVKAISAECLLRDVGSDDVSITYYDRSGHLLLQGPDAQDVIQTIHATLRQILSR